jgi:hypothetical protein
MYYNAARHTALREISFQASDQGENEIDALSFVLMKPRHWARKDKLILSLIIAT